MSQGPAVQSEFAVSSRSPTVRRSSWPFSRRGQHALSCCGVLGQVGTSKAMSSTSRSCSFLPGSGKDRREGRLPHPLGFLRPGGSQHGPGRTMLERWGTSCVPSGNMFRHLCSATQGYMVASSSAGITWSHRDKRLCGQPSYGGHSLRDWSKLDGRHGPLRCSGVSYKQLWESPYKATNPTWPYSH